MHLVSKEFLTLLPILTIALGCPEDVPGDGTEGGANGNPAAAGGGGGVVSNSGPTGGAHDCAGEYRVAQDAITDGVPLSGTVTCETCTGSVTISVLDLPPDKGGSDGLPCITTATIGSVGDFSLTIPSGLSAVNILTIDDNDTTSWGLQESVTVSEAGASGVSLIVGDKPVGTPKTSAGEALPSTMSGDGTGSPPEEVGTEAPGPGLEATEGEGEAVEAVEPQAVEE